MNAPHKHPYRQNPDFTFWEHGVSNICLEDFDPVSAPPFSIRPDDCVATAGSCFSQHISGRLLQNGMRFLQAEVNTPKTGSPFSARYGNIYTCLQLRQLLLRAYSLLEPSDVAWRRSDGRYVDPFRQREFPAGFESERDVVDARVTHLKAVRRVFEECDVFIFTMGLTESWIADADGAALPLPPGIIGAPETPRNYTPVNQTVASMTEDLLCFIDDLGSVNPTAKVILTVSPVPLVATFEARHVLVSNTFSKAALRVVADEVERQRPNVAYFPSFEIVSAMPRIAGFDPSDWRTVRPEVVERVMSIFMRHFYEAEVSETPRQSEASERPIEPRPENLIPQYGEFNGILCDEEMLGRPAAP